MPVRNRRILMQMAGLVPTPQEKVLHRYARKLARIDRDGKAQLLLVDMIQRREQGEEGTKPMPFAKEPDSENVT
jgi:hypothetical protein